MEAKRIIIVGIVIILVVMAAYFMLHRPVEKERGGMEMGDRIKLPEPRSNGELSLEKALLERRSIRDYSGDNLTVEEVSQLLWAAQGVTSGWGGRTAPSAGALYPLELYLVVGDVEGLGKGIYRYIPKEHELIKVGDRDVRAELAEAALGQEMIRDGAVDIVFTAEYRRTTVKYGERGIRYVHAEAGCAIQSVYLQATSLGLGTVVIGAFYDKEVKEILDIDEDPLYIMPVGRMS